nr:4-oxalocrotonate tautomerase family protein [Acidobacteriota bacterium]
PILKIFVIEGRTNDVKEALSDRLAVTLAEAGYGRDTVQVSVHDIPSSAWGIGGKTARDLGR